MSNFMSNLPGLWKAPLFGEPQSPLRALSRMQRDIDRMFEDFWSGNGFEERIDFSPMAVQPLCNVEEKGSHYLLKMDVPGFSKNDIKVEVLNNQLHIYGEKKEEREEEGDMPFESSYGSIEQWLALPPNTKAETLEAQIENGVLRVAIPKTEASKAKEIKVGEGKSGFFSKLLGKSEKVA